MRSEGERARGSWWSRGTRRREVMVHLAESFARQTGRSCTSPRSAFLFDCFDVVPELISLLCFCSVDAATFPSRAKPSVRQTDCSRASSTGTFLVMFTSCYKVLMVAATLCTENASLATRATPLSTIKLSTSILLAHIARRATIARSEFLLSLLYRLNLQSTNT